MLSLADDNRMTARYTLTHTPPSQHLETTEVYTRPHSKVNPNRSFATSIITHPASSYPTTRSVRPRSIQINLKIINNTISNFISITLFLTLVSSSASVFVLFGYSTQVGSVVRSGNFSFCVASRRRSPQTTTVTTTTTAVRPTSFGIIFTPERVRDRSSAIIIYC